MEIKTLICKCLWLGSKNMVKARVNWDDYTMYKKVGDLNLILPKDAIQTLMNKWIIQVLPPRKVNLEMILRYHITQLQPSYHGPWGPFSLWLFSQQYSIKR